MSFFCSQKNNCQQWHCTRDSRVVFFSCVLWGENDYTVACHWLTESSNYREMRKGSTETIATSTIMIPVMTGFQNVQASRWQLFIIFACGSGSSTVELAGFHFWGPFWLWNGGGGALIVPAVRHNNRKKLLLYMVWSRQDYLYSPHCIRNRHVPCVSVFRLL